MLNTFSIVDLGFLRSRLFPGNTALDGASCQAMLAESAG
jgi:hypothetical protein